MLRQCTVCGILKDIDNFHKCSKVRIDGRTAWCKDCCKQWRIYNKERLNKAANLAYHSNKHLKPPKTPEQKAIRALYNKNWRERNVEKRRVDKKRWNEKNVQEVLAYRAENKEKTSTNARVRLQTNLQAKLASNLRCRLKAAVRHNCKSGSAVRDLGCTIGEFKDHLESLFEKNMSWENYGNKRDQWSIDHIMPISKFDLTDRQHVLLCCYYLNLRPMWHIHNIQKSNKSPEMRNLVL